MTGRGGRVVADVEHDDPTLEQVHLALRGPDHRHLGSPRSTRPRRRSSDTGAVSRGRCASRSYSARFCEICRIFRYSGARLRLKVTLTEPVTMPKSEATSDADVCWALSASRYRRSCLAAARLSERQEETAAQTPGASAHPMVRILSIFLLLLLLLLLLITAPWRPSSGARGLLPQSSPLQEGKKQEGT